MRFMRETYTAVPVNESLSSINIDQEKCPSSFTQGRSLYSSWRWIGPLLILVLSTISIITSVELHRSRNQLKGCYLSSNGLSYKRNKERTIYQHSKYVSENETEALLAWEEILPGHGVVAIEPEVVIKQKLPETVVNPDGSGTHLYVVEAYHAIHCIKNLREHFVALANNASWDWSRSHDFHCFDALRQYVMCNIDDTLLKSTGHRDAGHDQRKMCHDWDALRDWAEERSAKYFDVEPGQGIWHMQNYHAGDGLPVGSLS